MAETITGQCYCGAVSLAADGPPEVVSYCHCDDCRRVTGAPVAAFAAFATDALHVTPALGAPISANPGVNRWFCHQCGSPLAATFDYLPGQVYVPLGLLDQADILPPKLHSHADKCLPWLQIKDDLPREHGSARDSLRPKPAGKV